MVSIRHGASFACFWRCSAARTPRTMLARGSLATTSYPCLFYVGSGVCRSCVCGPGGYSLVLRVVLVLSPSSRLAASQQRAIAVVSVTRRGLCRRGSGLALAAGDARTYAPDPRLTLARRVGARRLATLTLAVRVRARVQSLRRRSRSVVCWFSNTGAPDGRSLQGRGVCFDRRASALAGGA